jgi:EGF-like domain
MKPNIDPSNCILVQDVKSSQSLANPHLQNHHDGSQISSGGLTSINTFRSTFPTEDSLQMTTADHQNHHQTYQDQQLQSPLVQPSIMELKDFNILHQSIIPPYQFWNVEFRNKHPAFVNFNLTMPWGANFAIYGRRNVLPSVTQYDFVEFIKGGRLDQNRIRRRRDVIDDIRTRYDKTFQMLADSHSHHDARRINSKVMEMPSIDDNALTSPAEYVESTSFLHLSPNEQHIISKRSADGSKINMDPMMVNVTVIQYLDIGRWFLAIYNDELVAHSVQLIVSEAEGVSNSCPNDCSGHGSCYLGKCDCIDGYQGSDCSKSVCPVLCSAHGHYGGGICHCEDGWKGSECDIPVTECEMPTCSSHGRCIEGECHCDRGWKGPFCDQGQLHRFLNLVNKTIKIFFITQPIVRIRRARDMAAACPDSASVRQAGRAKIVELAINRSINAFPGAPITVITISRRARAYAIGTGQVTIVLRQFAVSIVDRMASVSRRGAVAIPDGREHCANSSHAILDAPHTDSAKMELACAHRDGTENIAHYVSFVTLN